MPEYGRVLWGVDVERSDDVERWAGGMLGRYR